MPVLIAAARGAAEVAKRTSASPTVQAIAETATNPKRATQRLIYVSPAMALAGLLLITALLGGGGVVHPSCASQTVVVFDGELDQVLLTIRTIESGNSYTAQAAGSSASGAYQFINPTWGNYGGYPEAWQAPSETQDAKAAEWASIILQNHSGDVSVVPVVWYIGHLPDPGSAEWDTVPVPGAGNVLTPREYQTKWLGVYANPTAAMPWNPDVGGEDGQTCSGVVGEGDYRIPDGVTQLVASSISWGGWSNGQIPLDAMRYSANSNYMHPAASAAWDQLHAAALAEGFDLRGNGYRPAAAGGATSGNSNHGWGLAIDISLLAVGTDQAAVDAAFASEAYVWLANNAPLYGFLNPAWAKPMSLGGNGNGGHVGDACCFLEPWHWEWAAFMTTTAPVEPVSA